MFNNYLATKDDLEIIIEALKFVMHSKMEFVFKNKSKIANTVIVSYDSKFIYMWKINPVRLAYRIPHKIVIKDEWQYAWRVGFFDQKIKESLPKEIKDTSNFETPKISGGLFTPFVELQKKIKGVKNNPYITKESYLATIIHEFAHIYWNSFKMWWPSDKKENLLYLNLAKRLSQNFIAIPSQKKRLGIILSLNFPCNQAFGEAFAYCSELYATSIFWPTQQIKFNEFDIAWLKKMIKEENKKDLEREDSILEPIKNPHAFALVFGRIILNKYPLHWPLILTSPNKLQTLL